MTFPGPGELGRGVVLLPGQEAPTAWAGCPRTVVGEAEQADPGPVVDELHLAWLERRAMVVELQADPGAVRAPERCDRAVYSLTPGFEFSRERLQFLIWANNYDSRGGEPVWWHGRRAARRFGDGRVAEGGPADVLGPDGTPLYVDGGPSGPVVLASGVGVVHRWNAEAGWLRPGGHRPPGAALAPDQLAAVGHGGGAARVIAPAGSGKTRVLTERLRHLVADRGVHPGTVTALAYNVKAAEEMKERCAEVLTAQGPHLRTLNSLGLWICNDFGSAGRRRVLEEPEVRDLLARLIDIRRQSNTDTVAPYLDALSAIRLGLASPRAVEEANPDAVGVADAFDRYRAALAESGSVDFDEQIYRAIEILLTDPEARTAAQARCRYLLVDEFQDLTPAHLLLIRLLAAPGFDCFGVGDDDQVIYGYSGATPEFLIDFPRYFPGAARHDLTINYRCPPAVVTAARHLLSYNRRRLEKAIGTPEGRRDSVPAVHGPLAGAGPVAVLRASAEDLARVAVETIGGWLDAGEGPDDIAVLARVNSALLPVQVACIEAGVPCSTPLASPALNRTGIRSALAYLRIGADPGRIRREDVLETVRRPSRGISPRVVEMATERRTTSADEIRRLAGRLTGRDAPKLETYAADLDAVARSCRQGTAAALRTVRVQIGLGETMDVLDTSRREADRSTHADDLAALESVAALHPEVDTFEEWLRATLARAPADGPLVLLSTVHRVKGREWDQVVVYGASGGLFPHRLSNDEEGERRVFHVALTRARTQVAILADADAPSLFLAELDGTRRHPPADDGARSADGAGARRRERHRPARGARPGVAAAVGMVIEDRGTTGTVAELTDAGAVLAVGTVRVSVPFGTEVGVEGRLVTLVAPGDGSAAVRWPSAPAEQALRAWRSSVASQEGIPAYVVLNDKELAGIAARLPGTLRELAACRGVGPIRLERWGDEILAVLEGVRPE